MTYRILTGDQETGSRGAQFEWLIAKQRVTKDLPRVMIMTTIIVTKGEKACPNPTI
jgi:hypothetical protein